MKAEPIRLVGVVVDQVTEPRNDGTPGSALYQIPIRLSRAPAWAWEKAFLNAWQFPRQFTSMHRPGIARIQGDCIILDGTTIEEVRDTHRATLVLCVEDANAAEAREK
jgi:hypothetical protein